MSGRRRSEDKDAPRGQRVRASDIQFSGPVGEAGPDGWPEPPVHDGDHLEGAAATRRVEEVPPAVHHADDADPHDDVPLYDDSPGDDGDFVELAPASGRWRRAGIVLLFVAIVLVVTAGAGAYWWQRQVNPPGPPGAEVAVEIPLDTSTGAIADLLEREGVIADATVFRWYVRLKSAGPFQAGLFTLNENSSMGDVVELLDAGPQAPPFARITFPEGLTVEEIAARLAEGVERFTSEEVQAVLDSGQVRSVYQPEGVTSLEGLLFPETYRIEDDEDAAAVLARMVATTDQILAELGVESAQEQFNLTPYEIVIAASLIEEETRVDAERPMVARVIYNRLAQGIPLGIDATSRYEAELAGRDRDDIDFDSDSPFNTRRQAGLPPTPIAAPSRDSIAAALAPADGPWIYYVLQDEEGNHFFTESDSEFLEAKQLCAERGLGCG
ncbi:hypothetical protein BH20ACT2_BH20ACT2_21890 [soil metagenome]